MLTIYLLSAAIMLAYAANEYIKAIPFTEARKKYLNEYYIRVLLCIFVPLLNTWFAIVIIAKKLFEVTLKLLKLYGKARLLCFNRKRKGSF